jgi:hypothetical protein
MQAAKTKYGVGASLLRREDDRHLRGRGEFVSDIRLPGTQHVVSCAARTRTPAFAR